ncbi:MAG: glycosyltransferase [Crocinitomicaceae bacterium]|nr:glycosyltransferase [Crocinitomicaceae bacterium]
MAFSSTMFSNQKILILGFVFPEPNSSAAGGRMIQLIAYFQSLKMEIVFACAAAKSEFSFPLESIGVRTEMIQLNNSSLDLLLTDLQPDYVLFDRFMMEEMYGWRVAEVCPNAIRILDTEDLHCLRQARQITLKENRPFEKTDLYSDFAKREIASILRCDLSLMISEFEMNILKDVFQISDQILLYLPIWMDVKSEEEQVQLKSFEEKKDFVFIGNFLHEPNWNAVHYLKTTIWPLIRKVLPTVELKIYGAYCSEKVLNLHHPKTGFLVEGRAVSATEVFGNARVCLAPLRFGAGIKGKLLESMYAGTPSVTTSIGSESMHGENPWNGFVCDDPIEFAQKAVELYEKQDIWKQAQRAGFEILKQRFSKDKITTDFTTCLSNLTDNIINHRQHNFTGSILQHHTMKSTMYMSRWIEEKNKKK